MAWTNVFITHHHSSHTVGGSVLYVVAKYIYQYTFQKYSWEITLQSNNFHNGIPYRVLIFNFSVKKLFQLAYVQFQLYTTYWKLWCTSGKKGANSCRRGKQNSMTLWLMSIAVETDIKFICYLFHTQMPWFIFTYKQWTITEIYFENIIENYIYIGLTAPKSWWNTYLNAQFIENCNAIAFDLCPQFLI